MRAFSAGSTPKGQVLPRTSHTLSLIAVFYNKGYEAFAQQRHKHSHYRMQQCHRRSACPIYLGNAHKSHWGLDDPSLIIGGTAIQQAAFHQTADIIEMRTRALFALPWHTFTAIQWTEHLQQIKQRSSTQ